MICIHSIQSMVACIKVDIIEELHGWASVMQQIVNRSVRSSSCPVASQCRVSIG